MSWAVAVCWPSYERRVERALKKAGFAVYLPRCESHTKRSTLLFPRYIFADGEQWRAVRETHGVSRLLRTSQDNHEPAIIPDSALEHIRRYEDESGLVKIPNKPKFWKGQRVRITLGAFTGLSGLYAGLSRRNREKVLLALGEVSLPFGNLVPDF
jgi:transcription antitermination factor NusG